MTLGGSLVPASVVPQPRADSSIEHTHSLSPTTTRTASVSAARATAHDPTAHASSSLPASTVTVRSATSVAMPKSFSSRAATSSGSPAVAGASRAQPIPAAVWPESHLTQEHAFEAVTRAWDSCWA